MQSVALFANPVVAVFRGALQLSIQKIMSERGKEGGTAIRNMIEVIDWDGDLSKGRFEHANWC